MTAQELLDYCRAKQVRLWVEGDTLRYDYPKGAISECILQLLRDYKAQVIALLMQPEVVTPENQFAVCSSSKEKAANCKQESGPTVEPIAWEGDIPIYVYPGEKCIRCRQRPAVGTPECPRWCPTCYAQDQRFWTEFYAGKPIPGHPPIVYQRLTPTDDRLDIF